MSSYKDRIIDLRKQGKSYREIEERLGCSRGTISYHCKQLGLESIDDIDYEKLSDEKIVAIQQFYKNHTIDETAEKFNVAKSTVKRYSDVKKLREPESLRNLFDVADETRRKIVNRLIRNENLSCFRCGWNETVCDIHHINGRSCENPHSHSNLTYLCPNCHRLADREIIDVEKVPTLEERVGNKWKEYYHGS